MTIILLSLELKKQHYKILKTITSTHYAQKSKKKKKALGKPLISCKISNGKNNNNNEQKFYRFMLRFDFVTV